MAFAGLMPYAALLLAALADVIGFPSMLRMCVVLYLTLALYVLVRVPNLQEHQPAPAPAPAPAS